MNDETFIGYGKFKNTNNDVSSLSLYSPDSKMFAHENPNFYKNIELAQANSEKGKKLLREIYVAGVSKYGFNGEIVTELISRELKSTDDADKLKQNTLKRLDEFDKKYKKLQELSKTAKEKHGVTIYDIEPARIAKYSMHDKQTILSTGSDSQQRLLEELINGRLSISLELVEYLNKRPFSLYDFKFDTKSSIENANDTPKFAGRERTTSFVPRPAQARKGRTDRYIGHEFLDKNSYETTEIGIVKGYLEEHKPSLAKKFTAFFDELEKEEMRYTKLAENGGTANASFRLNLCEPAELSSARRNKKDITDARRIAFIQNMERSFKAASWVARGANEVESMYNTVRSDASDEEKIDSLEASIKYMYAASGSQRGLVFDRPPLHGGNGGEDVRDSSERSYKVMRNIFQKTDGIFINSVEYQIDRSPADNVKVTLYHISSEPKETRTGDLGMAVRVTNNSNEKFLDTEQILMLENELMNETLATLVLNGKMKKYVQVIE